MFLQRYVIFMKLLINPKHDYYFTLVLYKLYGSKDISIAGLENPDCVVLALEL